MKTSRRFLAPALAASFLACVTMAGSGLSMAAGTAAQSKAAPSGSTASPSSLVVVQEDVLIPLIDQPEQHFHRAQKYFERGDRKDAAAEMRAGAALVELEAGRHNAHNKHGLDKAAKNLNQLAAQVESGKVKSEKPLRQAFAEADLALARHYHEMAEAALGHNDKNTGHWLRGAADSISDAAKWSRHKLASGAKASVDGARSLGAKIEGGAKWTVDEARQKANALGSEIESLAGGETSTASAPSNNK